jgi:RNA ligase (TIGR02306 family)
LVVYFEVDSVLPVRECFEFLRKGCHINRDWLPEGEGFRLKTIKLRKQISQGLVMGLSEVGISGTSSASSLVVGQDVTDELGVVKYDPPVAACMQGQAKGNFPAFIPKTDQERVQNCYDVVVNIDTLWEVTLKLEGSSMTIYKDLEGNWGVCSRNLNLKLDESNSENSFVKMFNNLMDRTYLSNLQNGMAIQGELMGEGIQGNIEGFSEHRFFVYDVFDISKQEYLPSSDRIDLIENLDLEHTPVLLKCADIQNVSLEDLLGVADGASINASRREGLVYKDIYNPANSFKTISNDYLLNGKYHG